MSTSDNCKCGGYGCDVCDPEAVSLADAGVRLAEQPQAMAGYVRVLAKLAMDWDERLMSDERSACQAGAAALTILIAKTSRPGETPARCAATNPRTAEQCVRDAGHRGDHVSDLDDAATRRIWAGETPATEGA